jgi:hypothetical protein
MSNSDPTKTPPSARQRQWGNSDDQQAAGRDFLQAVLDDDKLRKDVINDRGKAREKFAEKGKIDIPPDVEVICVEPTKEERSKAVVFVLPEKGDQLPSNQSTLKYWVAAWTPYSSARFKRDIQRMGDASSTILSLRPVTFRYKRELDPDDIPQFGLVAEEVEKTNPELVVHDSIGQPYGVRYDAVNAMLLNEFLKQHGKVEQQEETIAQQRRELDALTNKMEELSRSKD